MKSHIEVKRRVVIFKGRRYVVHDSYIRWREIVSVKTELKAVIYEAR